MAPESSGDPVKTQRAQKAPVWMYLGNISCLAGTILMIAAPGNFVRSGRRGRSLQPAVENVSALLRRSEGSYGVSVPCPAAYGICTDRLQRHSERKPGQKYSAVIAGALLSWGAMILSPHYPDRAAFGTMVLLICAILSMAGKIADRQKENVWMFYGCAVLIWLRGCIFWWNIWDYAGAGSNK